MEDDVLICSGSGAPAREGQEFCRSCGSLARESPDPVKLVIKLESSHGVESPDEAEAAPEESDSLPVSPENYGVIKSPGNMKTLPDDLARMIDSTPTLSYNPRVVNDHQIKIDREIGLEITGTVLLFCSSLTLIFLLLNGFYHMVEIPVFIFILIFVIAGSSLSLGVYIHQTIRIYYIIDLSRRAIIIHRTAFGKTTERIYRRFNEIAFITVQGIRSTQRRNWKSEYFWMYIPCMVFADGKKFNLVYGINDDSYTFGEQLSRRLAEVFGVRFIEGKKERYSRIVKDSRSGNYTVEHLGHWHFYLTLYRDPAAKYLAALIVFNLLVLYLIYTKREILYF